MFEQIEVIIETVIPLKVKDGKYLFKLPEVFVPEFDFPGLESKYPYRFNYRFDIDSDQRVYDVQKPNSANSYKLVQKQDNE